MAAVESGTPVGPATTPAPGPASVPGAPSGGSAPSSATSGDTEIPKALLKRLIKAKLSAAEGADPGRDYQVAKDCLLAFQEAAKLFIHYLTATANDICRDAKRQTISADDVLTALGDLEFEELVQPLQEALEGGC